MKKRIFSVVIAAALMFSSVSAVFAEVDIAGTASDVYEGNKPFIQAEDILDKLNDEAVKIEPDFSQDKDNHIAQLDVIKAVNESLDTKTLDKSIDFLTANLTDYQKSYLAALVMAESNDEIKAGLAEHGTTGKSLKESFALLDDYVLEMETFFNAKGIDKEDYTPEVAEKARKFVKEPLLAILKVMFAQDGTAENSYDDSGKYMRENYVDGFIYNDRAKKTLAVLFGADLTREIVSDSADGEQTRGIVRHVKKYISENSQAIVDVKSLMGSIMVEEKVLSVDAMFDTLGKIVNDAYKDEPLQSKVTMLMGNGVEPGLVELLIKDVDNAELDASNVWVNLFLSEFVQIYKSAVRLNSVDESNVPAEIKDNSYITFSIEGLDDYGIGDGQATLSLNTGWFDVAFYAEDTPGSKTYTKTSNVSYDASRGQIQITNDSTKDETYGAYLVLYRKSATDDVTTFIESYPVTIENRSISTSTGGGGSSRYTLKFETNGGTKINNEIVSRGTTVELTQVPSREGYEFTGWYLDAALTQKADSVKVSRNITVYAGWKEIKMADVPEMLNGEEHFAYVVGYPGGEVRPYANITRAETATIIFRLLKDAVRDENLTTENSFSDVNEENWYNKAVSTLAALNIVNGRTETEFAPDAFVTRAEFATILARFMDEEFTDDNALADIDGHWAEEYINEATYYGWIKGYEDNTFRPDNNITRAEAMTLINRVLHRLPETTEDLHIDMVKWSDNSDTTAWFYLAVQEATNSHSYAEKKANNEKWTGITEGRDWTQYQ